MEARTHVEGERNSVSIHPSVKAVCKVEGNDNTVIVEETSAESTMRIILKGSNCTLKIGPNSRCRGMDIRIGTYIAADEVQLEIGAGFTSEDSCRLLLYNRNCRLSIGNDCMFSNSIIVRCGESPHLIFDKETGAYLDTGGDVRIGHHVWVGERAYITKRAQIADDCILAAAAVASRVYPEPNCVIAGNPGVVVRKGVEWVRNRGALEPGSAYRKSYDAFWRR